ncbi:hypothetical protein [Kribbella sp. NPDC051620]|uniref:hypothetical protein n=1 Tax=Kribbella sp. NPDC051620 TaxID=3364120 RepID=UPI0037ACD84B
MRCAGRAPLPLGWLAATPLVSARRSRATSSADSSLALALALALALVPVSGTAPALASGGWLGASLSSFVTVRRSPPPAAACPEPG